jgi:ATP:corrinoid adenosyltransferase
MTEDAPDHDNARHHEKMAKKKAARDKIMAGKTIEKGLLIVHTGKGKGPGIGGVGLGQGPQLKTRPEHLGL